MANRVFEDRPGVWVINPANLPDRLPKLEALGLLDVFLPRIAAPEDVALVRAGGCYAHLWVAPDGLNSHDLANRTLLDHARLKPGAVELNLELSSDVQLPAYIEDVVGLIRSQRKSLRLRVNVAWRKGRFLPIPRLQSDPHLYACEQCYVDPPGMSMSPTSPVDALADLLDAGVPPAKATVCYGAAGPVGGTTGPQRVCTVPHGGGWWPRRGVIFHDDLMADVGLL